MHVVALESREATEELLSWREGPRDMGKFYRGRLHLLANLHL